jgi:hypothetical protein
VRTPSSRALQSIADALDMTPSELLAMADHVADGSPQEAVQAASGPAASHPDDRERSRWFTSPSQEAPPPALAAMSAMSAPGGPPPSQERPTDQDLAQLVTLASNLTTSDVRLLIELARRLRG